MAKDYKDLKIGREFEIIQAKQQMLQEQTRSALAVILVIAALIALALAAFMGSADASLKVWGLIAAPIGVVIGYYFRGSKTNGEKNN